MDKPLVRTENSSTVFFVVSVCFDGPRSEFSERRFPLVVCEKHFHCWYIYTL